MSLLLSVIYTSPHVIMGDVLSLCCVPTRASKAGKSPDIMHGLAMSFKVVATPYNNVANWARVHVLPIDKHRVNMLPNLKRNNTKSTLLIVDRKQNKL